MKKFAFNQVRFLKSCKLLQHCPRVPSRGTPLPEIAVAGRSNVGKSSLLNHLFRTKGLVKTSQKPGKTRLLNFFQWEDRCLFCDLPGYGYAQVSPEEKASWKAMTEAYIEKREPLRLILMLLDIRRVPSEQDIQFLEWVNYHQRPVILVFTKIDKLSKNVLTVHVKNILDALPVKDLPTLFYSVPKNTGRTELLAKITPYMNRETHA